MGISIFDCIYSTIHKIYNNGNIQTCKETVYYRVNTMGIKDMWNNFKDKQAAKQAAEAQTRAEQEALRQEVLKEIQPEIREIMKDRIKQEELAKAQAAAQPKDKMAGLNKLAEEFKGANLGTNDQMSKLLGNGRGVSGSGPARGTKEPLSNEKIAGLMSSSSRQPVANKDYGKLMGGSSLNTNRNIGNDLGVNHKFRKDHANIIGGTPNKDYGKLMGKPSEDGDVKIKKMLGRR